MYVNKVFEYGGRMVHLFIFICVSTIAPYYCDDTVHSCASWDGCMSGSIFSGALDTHSRDADPAQQD